MDGGEPGRQPPQFDINALQVPVVLPVPAWQRVLDYLGKQPWCDVDALMRAMYQQVQRAVEQRQNAELEQAQPRVQHANGVAAQQSWQQSAATQSAPAQYGQLPQ